MRVPASIYHRVGDFVPEIVRLPRIGALGRAEMSETRACALCIRLYAGRDEMAHMTRGEQNVLQIGY